MKVRWLPVCSCWAFSDRLRSGTELSAAINKSTRKVRAWIERIQLDNYAGWHPAHPGAR